MENENDLHEQEAALRRLDRTAKETTFVRWIMTGIAEPLAQAFHAMPEAGLLTTRYELYTNACEAILLNGHVIPFMQHNVNVPDLLDEVWRTTKESAQ